MSDQCEQSVLIALELASQTVNWLPATHLHCPLKVNLLDGTCHLSPDREERGIKESLGLDTSLYISDVAIQLLDVL
jgi:hypothetical protein